MIVGQDAKKLKLNTGNKMPIIDLNKIFEVKEKVQKELSEEELAELVHHLMITNDNILKHPGVRNYIQMML